MLADLIARGGGPEAIAADLSEEEIDRVIEAIKALQYAEKFGKFDALFPEEGPLRRELYTKHMEFFTAGKDYRERCAMAGNRVGKTMAMGGYEMTCHLTGLYPAWWPGRRFRMPVDAWACGKTSITTRDVVQKTLLGDVEFFGSRKVMDGSGLIPRHLLGREPGTYGWRQGVSDLIDTIKIRHVTGGYSNLGLKSYEQGRGAFEGTAKHVVWDDEEPPMEIYSEQLIRTATTGGIMMLTFTPLQGYSEVVNSYLNPPDEPRRAARRGASVGQ